MLLEVRGFELPKGRIPRSHNPYLFALSLSRVGHSAAFPRFSNSVAYYGLAMDLQKFGLSIYLVQALFGIIDIPAMLVATTTMIYVGRRATVASFLILAGLMVIVNMFVPEGESSCLPRGNHTDTDSRNSGSPSGV